MVRSRQMTALGILLALPMFQSRAEKPAPRPGEMLDNPGFENVLAEKKRPAGWSLSTYDTKSTIALDHSQAHSGAVSVRIDGVSGGRAGIHKGFPADRTDPAALYVFSAWIKTAGQSDARFGTSVRFTSVDAENRVIKSDYRVCDPGPFDWRFHTWFVRLPAKTRRFNIVLFHHGTGSAWWDDVSLRPTRPVAGLAPAFQSAVADPRPEFRWQAPADAPGRLFLYSPDNSGFFLSRKVRGNHFQPAKPLPTARDYRWYVLFQAPDGMLQTTVFQEDHTPQPGLFYAGSVANRLQGKLNGLESYRPLDRKLRALAERNGMWDRFSLLGHFLDTVDTLKKTGNLPADMTEKQLLEARDELRLRTPWWHKIFLDDNGLFGALRLDAPGLETVNAAVEAKDFPRARQELLDWYRTRKTPSYYRKWEARPARNPARVIDARAEQLLTHRMPVQGYKKPTFDLGPAFDWHVLPTVDREWPTKLHRHYHWSALAGAYWSTGNNAYAREIVLQLLDWAEDNPMEAWDYHRYRWAWSTLNATVRIYSSWINAWLRIRTAPAWTPDAQFVMLTLLREHGRFLMTHHAKTGNWVVAEARGLVELGIMFPEFKEAEAWRNEGFRRLRREIDRQVLADGVHVERSPGYHGMTLSCFLEPIKLALLNNITVPDREHILQKIESMFEFYLYGCRPDRRMAQIGDAGMTNVVPWLRKGWKMFGREDMLYVATNGTEGKPPVHRSYGFEAGGFYVSRSSWTDPNALWSIMDWGGFLGHCHDDMGQICLYARGAPLLVDSGRYSYAWPMRRYFHETIGHNTVLVDRKTQKRRDPLSCRWSTCGHFDLVRGLTDNSEPLQHERTLVFKQPAPDAPGYWVVLDRLTGPGRHRLDQRWHTNEKLTGKITGSTVVFRNSKNPEKHPGLMLAALPQAKLQTAIEPGWISYQWYKKRPLEVAQFTIEGECPAVFATVLFPIPAGAPPPRVGVEALPARLDGRDANANEVTAFTVTVTPPGTDTPAVHDLWLFRHGAAGEAAAAGMRLAGRVACVAMDAPRTSWMATEAAALQVGTQRLFQAQKPVAAISRRGAAVVSSAAANLRFAADVPCRVNDAGPFAPHDGTIHRDRVEPPPAPPPPRAFREPRVVIEAPPEPVPPTGFAALLPAAKKMPPAKAVVINAAAFFSQGGGAVEATTRKVGIQGGKAFLHWDLAGHWLEYAVNVPAAGMYRLLVRACTAQPAAVRRITVNGKTPAAGAAQEFAGTGGFSGNRDDWRVFVVADRRGNPLGFHLHAGKNRIRLENVDGRSLNLNWLALAPVGDNAPSTKDKTQQ